MDGLSHRSEAAPFCDKGAAHNFSVGPHSRSLIQVKIHSPDDGCSNSKAASAPTPDGFAFVPYVPFSWTAVVGLSKRPVKQRAAGVHLVRALGRAVRRRKNSACPGALKLRPVDNSRLIAGCNLDRCIVAQHQGGAIMAKRKKGSKVQKRGKLRRVNSAKRGKASKAGKSAKATKRTAKPKPAPVKKTARKVKQPVAPAVETVAVEKPAPDVITVTEGLDPAA